MKRGRHLLARTSTRVRPAADREGRACSSPSAAGACCARTARRLRLTLRGGAAAAVRRGPEAQRRPRAPPVVRLDARELAAIFAGGFLGALARAGLAEALPHAPGQWPWATFAVNVAGAFLLGYFVTRLQERLPLSAYRRPFLGTGLCGALTTFSTMQLELLRMLDGGRIALAAGYAAASVVAGFVAVRAGDQRSCGAAGWRVSARGVARRRRCSAASARSRASCSTARCRRGPGALPVGHAGGQPVGRVVLGVARRRSRCAATRCRLVGHGLLGAYTTFSHVDVREPPAGRGRRGRAGVVNLVGSLCSGSRRSGSAARSGGAVSDDCVKLTVYFGERDRVGHRFLADALRDVFARAGTRSSLY